MLSVSAPLRETCLSKFCLSSIDAFIKSRKPCFPVIPAKAGIPEKQGVLDPGFRRGDDHWDFLRLHQF
jgi:hypothetical protein